ncbi:hypothetical protein [uncultured Winogradskyella sp.]|uniref:hypothetical protein n=2 Tax=uncultured Winogradskyella sp. TaxID=395353 RepID=UPI0026070E84|nr:hypothetical protein [uncultured Winogradskyella sp.]
MKTLKLTLFSLMMALMVLTSCTNNESVIEEPQNTEESESITNALLQLRTQFDDSGNVTQTDNPAGNIVLDFCFDFIYPLNLSYNNGTTVSVTSLDGLINIMLSSTDNLYINGIAFPFNAETYNDSTNAIEVVTISNENEFIALLESCDFNVEEPCECFEVYQPVCVVISDPNGDIFTVTYSNACYAACDGFTEDDFAENCEEDYNSNGNDCFSLNFPITIITDENATITINSQEELDAATYNSYYFDFVYPIDITLNNGNVTTINTREEIEAILYDCYDINTPNECEECANEPQDIVCVNIEQPDGSIYTYPYDNACYALCAGYTEADFVFCNSGNDLCLPSATSSALVSNTGWTISNIDGSQELDIYEITFNSDGTLQWTSNGASFSGTWSVEDNPTEGNIITLSFSGPNLQQATGQWRIVDCNLPCSISLFSNNGNEMELSRPCD